MEIYIKEDSKDFLVDLLLENDIDEFYFFNCKRYSSKQFLNNTQEQVSGRSDFVMFKIFDFDNTDTSLIEQMKFTFGNDIRIYCFA